MLLGIVGKKRSGKDTMGDYLVEAYGFKKARPLAIFKDATAEWLGWDERHLDGELKEVVDELYGFSPRQLWEKFGSEVMKDDLGTRLPLYHQTCGNEIWVRAFHRWYTKQPKGNYVLCDVRMLCEVNYLNRYITDVKFVKTTSDRSPYSEAITEKEVDLISTEHELVNNGYDTFDAFYKKIDEFMKTIS